MRRFWVTMLLVFGCAAEPTDDSVGDGVDRGEGDPPVEEIVIPVRPVESANLYGLPELIEAPDGPSVRLEVPVRLALGDGYPREFTGVLQPSMFASCGPLVGPIALTRLDAEADGVVGAELSGPTAVVFSAAAPGQERFTAGGTITLELEGCEQPAGATLPFELVLDVTVLRAADARIQGPCSGDLTQVAPSSHASAASFNSWFLPVLVDEAGEPFVAANAEANAQVGVRLHGAFDSGHASPESLSYWMAPSRPGVVEIVPTFGEPMVVDVVDPSRITAVDIEFQLAGTAAGPVILESGSEYGQDGWARVANRIAPMVQELRTESGPVCSAPPPESFVLETQTPDVCEVVELSVFPGKTYTLLGDRTGQAARLLRSGKCSLALSAPEFGSTASLPTLTAAFHNIADLQDW